MKTKGLYLQDEKVSKTEVMNILKNIAGRNDIKFSGYDLERDRFEYSVKLDSNKTTCIYAPFARLLDVQYHGPEVVVRFIVMKETIYHVLQMFPYYRYMVHGQEPTKATDNGRG